MAIKIKRSSGNLAPESLAAGQLAYSEGSTNGGTLYYGEIGGTVREIAGKKFVDKLDGIEAGAEVNTVDSVAGKTGAVTLAAADITDFNTTVDGRITSNAVTGALGFTPEDAADKGVANGYASLDSSGLVPSTQLPSYVDDVLEYANLAGFPETGESGKIYVAIDTSKTYRWSGSTYVEISASPGSTDAVTEGTTNKYFTQARARESISVTDAGGEGSLSYSESTGVITYTGPDLSGYATTSSLSTVASSGSYDDLDDKPSLFSGNYADLTNRPEIPTTTSDLTNDSGFITDVIQDTSPQLGADLDTNGHLIVGTGTAPTLGSADFISVNSTGLDLYAAGGRFIDLTTVGANTIVNRNDGSASGAPCFAIRRKRTDTTLASMDNVNSNLTFQVRDNTDATSSFVRFLSNYRTSGSHSITLQTSSDNFSTQTNILNADTGNLRLGPSAGTTGSVLTTNRAGNITISTNNGTNSGTITINAGSDSNIEITPNGTGRISLDGLLWPSADGVVGQVLTTDAMGNLSWTTASGFSGDYNDLTNKPTLFSGSYNDLSDKPTLFSGSYTDLTDKPSLVTTFTALSDTPSAFTSSAGFFVRVNSGATALEFSQDVDDGTF